MKVIIIYIQSDHITEACWTWYYMHAKWITRINLQCVVTSNYHPHYTVPSSLPFNLPCLSTISNAYFANKTGHRNYSKTPNFIHNVNESGHNVCLHHLPKSLNASMLNILLDSQNFKQPVDNVSTLCNTCHTPLPVRQSHGLYASIYVQLTHASISTSIVARHVPLACPLSVSLAETLGHVGHVHVPSLYRAKTYSGKFVQKNPQKTG